MSKKHQKFVLRAFQWGCITIIFYVKMILNQEYELGDLIVMIVVMNLIDFKVGKVSFRFRKKPSPQTPTPNA